MIANPCDASIEPVFLGDLEGGVAIRLRQRLVLHGTAAKNCGMVVWYPGYHNGGVDGVCATTGTTNSNYSFGSNCFVFETATPGTAPTNLSTAGSALGNNIASDAACGHFLADPAFSYLSDADIGEASTLAACMRIKYLGSTSAQAGEVALVRHLSPADFINADTATPSVQSVSQIFNYASYTERLTSGRELKFRPTDTSMIPRTVGSYGQQDNAVDGLYDNGVDAVFATPKVSATGFTVIAAQQDASRPQGIAIAWMGLNTANTGDLVIELTKVVQYHVRPRSGIMEPTPVRPSARKRESLAIAVDNIAKVAGTMWDIAWFRRSGCGDGWIG